MKTQAPETQSSDYPQAIRLVDLFAGCGGLSLGFAIFNGQPAFDEILAIDNDPAAIRCFNDNRPDSTYAVGRTADVNWFNHPSEILLYYLLHFARLKQDEPLSTALDRMGVPGFLAQIRMIDLQLKA